jgi:hypothetical protein
MEQKLVSNIGTILAALLTLYALVTGVFLISENSASVRLERSVWRAAAWLIR